MSNAIVTISNAFCSESKVKTTKNGNQVMEFGVAVNSKKGDKEFTTWYQVELWNGNLEGFLSRYSPEQVKGANITITGRQDIETYTNAQGVPGFKIVVKNPSIIAFYPKPESQEAEASEEVLQANPESYTSEF